MLQLHHLEELASGIAGGVANAGRDVALNQIDHQSTHEARKFDSRVDATRGDDEALGFSSSRVSRSSTFPL